MFKFMLSMGLVIGSLTGLAGAARAVDDLPSGRTSGMSQNLFAAWPSFVPANASVKIKSDGYRLHSVAYEVARGLIDQGHHARIHKEGALYYVYAWR